MPESGACLRRRGETGTQNKVPAFVFSLGVAELPGSGAAWVWRRGGTAWRAAPRPSEVRRRAGQLAGKVRRRDERAVLGSVIGERSRHQEAPQVTARVAGLLYGVGEGQQLGLHARLGQVVLQLGRDALKKRGGAARAPAPQHGCVLAPKADTLRDQHCTAMRAGARAMAAERERVEKVRSMDWGNCGLAVVRHHRGVPTAIPQHRPRGTRTRSRTRRMRARQAGPAPPRRLAAAVRIPS
jgi:hypothetical protein